MNDISVTLGQIKQVAAICIAIGTALSIGEVRIQKLEIHKETYEKIASATKQKAIQNEKDLAVVKAELKSHIAQQRQLQLTKSEFRW
tara:strand:+ start:3020 stop:3280 length:261 start_codon:yes stop_codon:yes gene_type:complete